MQRQQRLELFNWMARSKRKPLIVKGARQVGKSTLVRLFAEQTGRRLVEVNLERFPELQGTFATLNIDQIINALEALPNVGQINEGDLIFLDEIQEIPHAISALRYFYEDQREIPVIAAGSLFDLALADQHLSMPVGRVEYLNMVPMTFTEFLDALGEKRLVQVIREYEDLHEVNDFVHQRLCSLAREYSFVGGMPEAVEAYVSSRRFSEAGQIHSGIIQSFRDDFPKYLGSTKANRVAIVLNTVARNVGQKVKYVNYSRELPSREIKADLEHLHLARLISKVVHSNCNGIPLQAEQDPKAYKLLFLDVGLMNTICGLEWSDSQHAAGVRQVNQGIAAEQFVGQHLLAKQSDSVNRELNYWLRERRTYNAEVDFVVALGDHVAPIQVKSGAGGSLKSLHQFVAEKHVKFAVRFDTNSPSTQRIQTVVRVGQETIPVDYVLVSLPLYLVEALPRVFRRLVGE